MDIEHPPYSLARQLVTPLALKEVPESCSKTRQEIFAVTETSSA